MKPPFPKSSPPHVPDVADSPLGQATAYINQYDAALLYPLPRQGERLGFYGVDIWNAYEVSWLNLHGKPLVRLAEFRIPAASRNIIESKSFKLYLNSFNLTPFASEAEVQARLVADLSQAAGAPVAVTLLPVDQGLVPKTLQGQCLDDLDVSIRHYTPEPALLQTESGPVVKAQWVSHLLKSNCPVTGQPDWASIQISYEGPRIQPEGLLAYLVSYREHGDFHEACVEQIFADLQQRCQPSRLSVYARYVRRGGLDINPFRSTHPLEPENLRQLRQ